jgi:hypothetical protein
MMTFLQGLVLGAIAAALAIAIGLSVVDYVPTEAPQRGYVLGSATIDLTYDGGQPAS